MFSHYTCHHFWLSTSPIFQTLPSRQWSQICHLGSCIIFPRVTLTRIWVYQAGAEAMLIIFYIDSALNSVHAVCRYLSFVPLEQLQLCIQVSENQQLLICLSHAWYYCGHALTLTGAVATLSRACEDNLKPYISFSTPACMSAAVHQANKLCQHDSVFTRFIDVRLSFEALEWEWLFMLPWRISVKITQAANWVAPDDIARSNIALLLNAPTACRVSLLNKPLTCPALDTNIPFTK